MTNYNRVFERLVDETEDDDEELIGLVAYGLYKSAKREWLTEFVGQNKKSPTQTEYEAYANTQTPAVLNGYRSQAREIMGDYAAVVVDDERPKIVQDALRGNFFRSFWSSFAASFAYSLAILALYGIIVLLGVPLPGMN